MHFSIPLEQMNVEDKLQTIEGLGEYFLDAQNNDM